MIRPCSSDIINDYKTQGKWKIHLAMAINFFSSKDSEETCTMYSKSDNIDFLILFYKDTKEFRRIYKSWSEFEKNNKSIALNI